MPETITSPAEQNAEVVIPAPGTGKSGVTDATLMEMEAVGERRYGKKPDNLILEPKENFQKKPDSEKGGIPELRKSREEAIEKLKGHEKALAERDTELTALRKQVMEFDGTRKEYETLKIRVSEVEKERDQYKKLDSIAAWEADPETHKKFTEPQGRAVDRLKELAGLADIDPDELVAASGKTGKAKVAAMDELLEGRSRFVVDDIVQTIRAMEDLAAARADELANVDERMQERRTAKESEGRKAREERAAVRDTAWKITAEHLAKELGISDQDLAEDAEFFKINKDAGKAAQRTIRGGKAFDAMKARAETAETELKKYDRAAPRIEAGMPVGTGGKVDVKAERKAMIAEYFPTR